MAYCTHIETTTTTENDMKLLTDKQLDAIRKNATELEVARNIARVERAAPERRAAIIAKITGGA